VDRLNGRRLWPGTRSLRLPFYAFTRYDGDAKVAGALLACFGVSAVVGNMLSFRIRRRFEPSVVIAVGVLAQAAPALVAPRGRASLYVAAALLLAGLANGVVNPSLHAMLTLVIPAAVRAQALTAVLAVNQLAAPAGFLGAGLLLANFGTRWVFVLVPVVQTVAMGARARDTPRPSSDSGYGRVSRAQRFSSSCEIGSVVAEPPKSSVPAENTFAPAAVS
jgi:MFS family permease